MKKWHIVVGVIVLLLLLFVGNDFYHTYQYRKNALLGLEAYEAGDCQTADTYFSKATVHGLRTNTEIANFMRRGASIYSKRRDCQTFLKGVEVQEQGEFSEALLTYDALLSEDTLVSPIREQIASLFDQAEPADIADEAVCLKLPELREREAIPHPQDNLPALYAACGAVFFEEERYGEAVTMYQRLLEMYPDHPLAQTADEKLAQALISEAEAGGAGTIGQPQSIKSTGQGPARVVIQNDSPQRISLVFTGLETLFEELEPCDTCENYTGSGPSACPEEGPIGTYELPAGTYKVAVKSISSGRVVPFTGEWTLRTGEVYYSCFYLVTRR